MSDAERTSRWPPDWAPETGAPEAVPPLPFFSDPPPQPATTMASDATRAIARMNVRMHVLSISRPVPSGARDGEFTAFIGLASG